MLSVCSKNIDHHSLIKRFVIYLEKITNAMYSIHVICSTFKYFENDLIKSKGDSPVVCLFLNHLAVEERAGWFT